MENLTDKSEKVVDLDYLIELSKGNKVFVKEMINLFLSENPEEIKSLETGIKNSNHEQIKTTAHKLKSTIPFMGLDKVIGNEVSEIETLATEHGNIKEIEKRFATIKKMCEKACYELTPS